jgi:hypothetical protein
MGCNTSKEGIVSQPSKLDNKSNTLDNEVEGNGSQSSIIASEGIVSQPRIIANVEDIASGFGNDIKAVETNMRQANYDTLTDYLTEATKCLLLLVQELKKYHQTEATHEQGQTCDPKTLQTQLNLLHRQFGRRMSALGFFSANTKAFEPIFKKLGNNVIITKLIDAILICIYLIIILHDVIIDKATELNNYFKRPDLVNWVARPTKLQINLNTHKFNSLKTNLLNKIEKHYIEINEDRDTTLKTTIINSVFTAMDNKSSKNKYDEIREKMKHDPKTIELIKNELEELVVKATPRIIARKLQAESKGGSILYKHQIQQIRKLLTNKKLTEKQKEQYKRKINKLKLKIEKEQKLNKINKIKDKLKKANTILKNKKLTDKQKQQLQIKIKNYKNQIKKLSS